MGWRGYNYQRRRGKAALDAATTTGMVLATTSASGLGRSHARRRPEVAPWDGGGITTKEEGGRPH